MPPLDAADLSFDDLIPAQNRGGPAEKKPSAADLSFDDLIPSQTASAQPGAPAQQNALRDMQRNIAAGVLEGDANAINIFNDPFGNLIGKPLATTGVFLHDWLAPKLGYDRFPDDVRKMLLEDNVPQPGSALISGIDNALGGNLAAIKPNTEAQKLVRAGISGGVTAATLGPLTLASPLAGIASGVGGTLAGEAARGLAETGGGTCWWRGSWPCHRQVGKRH